MKNRISGNGDNPKILERSSTVKDKLVTQKLTPPKMSSREKQQIVDKPDGRRAKGGLEKGREIESDEEITADAVAEQSQTVSNAGKEKQRKKENTSPSAKNTNNEMQIETAQDDMLANACIELTNAISAGDVSIVKQLISQNPGLVAAADRSNQYPLLRAIYGGQEAIAKELILANASLDHQYSQGRTALMVAIDKGFTDLAKILIGKGTNIHLADLGGQTALMYAVEKGQIEIAEMLIDHQANINWLNVRNECPLHMANRYGHTKVVALLIEKGAYVNLPDKDNRTVLMHATLSGHTDIVSLLIKNNAAIDIERMGETALDYAISAGHHPLVSDYLSRVRCDLKAIL